MTVCTCRTVDLGRGEKSRDWPDPDCPEHGRGSLMWKEGDSLRKFARAVVIATGETLEPHDARRRFAYHELRFETPLETERRLLAELTKKEAPA